LSFKLGISGFCMRLREKLSFSDQVLKLFRWGISGLCMIEFEAGGSLALYAL
jgi:hypothetical protein